MKKLKYSLGALVASLALALGVAMPVGAFGSDTSCVDNSCNNTTTNNDNDVDTTTKTYNCSVIDSNVETDADAKVEDNDKESTINATANGGDVSLTCTTNNVTNVTNQAAAPQVLAAQTDAPKGGVSAGAGGAVASATGSIVGLFASVATLGAGFVARRKFNV